MYSKLGRAGEIAPSDAEVQWWAPVSQALWWLSLDIIPLALTVAALADGGHLP